ncbi:MAG: putative N-acetyltransferase YsnE [Bacteroidota bacterium]|jgi:GNAT superfamily N-acetyltransferase
MVSLNRSNGDDLKFRNLVVLLDQDLAMRNGLKNDFFAKYNKINKIKYAVVAYHSGEAVGCGAFKEFGDDVVEIKRMFVKSEWRGRAIAQEILLELIKWAAELGYKKCVLETGDKMPEAIRLYERNGFERIANYGPYVNETCSFCFGRSL